MKTEISRSSVDLHSSVSFGGGVDRNDGDYWDEAAAFTGTMAAGLGGLSAGSRYIPGGQGLSAGSGLASFGLTVVTGVLVAADDAFSQQ